MTIGAEEKEIDFEEIFKNTPLFMNDLPENMEDFPELEALQSLAFDGNPMEIAENFKNQGNERYTVKNYKEAITFYKKGLAQDQIDLDMKIVLKLNMAQCHLLLHNFRSCYLICLDVLQMDRKSEKAYYRGLQALLKCERFEESYELAKVANHFSPSKFFEKTIRDCLKKKVLKEREELRLKQLKDEKDSKYYEIVQKLKVWDIVSTGDLRHCLHIPVVENGELLVPVSIRIDKDPILFEKVALDVTIGDLMKMANLIGAIFVDIDASGSKVPINPSKTVLKSLQFSSLVGGCLSLSHGSMGGQKHAL